MGHCMCMKCFQDQQDRGMMNRSRLMTVEVFGVKKEAYNGQQGVMVELVNDGAAWKVKLNNGEVKNFSPQNLKCVKLSAPTHAKKAKGIDTTQRKNQGRASSLPGSAEERINSLQAAKAA